MYVFGDIGYGLLGEVAFSPDSHIVSTLLARSKLSTAGEGKMNVGDPFQKNVSLAVPICILQAPTTSSKDCPVKAEPHIASDSKKADRSRE